MNKVVSVILEGVKIYVLEVIFGILSIIFFWIKSPKNIKGQLVLVTGGAQGLGKAVVVRLAKEGCNIAICDINIEEAKRTCQEIKTKYHIECEAFKADVSDTDQINQLFDEIKTKMGTVDILVNNAGILAPLGVLEGEDNDIKRVININLNSHFWMVRKFLPAMIEQKRGHIVGICSAAGKSTIPFAAYYCASKYGVNGFYSSLYDEMCIYDYDNFIQITCAFPGFINTRTDLKSLLDESFQTLPRSEPDYAAKEIVDGILFNKRDITFPFSYKIATLLQYTTPPKTMRYTKNMTCKRGVHCLDARLKMAKS